MTVKQMQVKMSALRSLIMYAVGKTFPFALACHTLNHWKWHDGSRAGFGSWDLEWEVILLNVC